MIRKAHSIKKTGKIERFMLFMYVVLDTTTYYATLIIILA